jgi:hypothetical protein
MKKLFFISAFFLAIIFSGCNEKETDPVKPLTQFIYALNRQDIVSAKKLATNDSQSMLDIISMGLKEQKAPKEGNMFDSSRILLGRPNINEDNATIKVTDKISNESIDFLLKKEKGEWKVAFDLATLMKIGMSKMKERNDRNAKILDETINGINKVGIDSLRNGLDQSMKQLDSVRKVIHKMEHQ